MVVHPHCPPHSAPPPIPSPLALSLIVSHTNASHILPPPCPRLLLYLSVPLPIPLPLLRTSDRSGGEGDFGHPDRGRPGTEVGVELGVRREMIYVRKETGEGGTIERESECEERERRVKCSQAERDVHGNPPAP